MVAVSWKGLSGMGRSPSAYTLRALFGTVVFVIIPSFSTLTSATSPGFNSHGGVREGAHARRCAGPEEVTRRRVNVFDINDSVVPTS
nr:hypothetical protein [Fodinicola feengrottensis]